MNPYALSHLADHDLKQGLAAFVGKDSRTTAHLLAHIAEFDERRLFAPAAHPSMHSYCVHVLGLSADAANKRIRVARKAREYPAIFPAVAEGRLHLSGAAMLASHLTLENVDELLTAAAHKTNDEIEAVIAQHFPRQDAPTRITPVSASPELLQGSFPPEASTNQLAARPVETSHPRVTPLAPERFCVQFTMRQEMFTKLRYAQSLLGHQVSSGDLPELLERALDALIAKLEKTKFAATDRPRAARPRTSTNPRYVPAHVRRAVNERDGGQCTFVSADGARCPERSSLEFDHILEVARGGEASVDGLRLRCRPHNQYEAERTFGSGFMKRKREEAQSAAAERRATAAGQPVPANTIPVVVKVERTDDLPAAGVHPTTESHSTNENLAAAQQEVESDLLHCLKGLGWHADQAHLAIEHTRGNPEASIEERRHAAIRFVGLRGRTYALRQAVMNRSVPTGCATSGPR